MCVCASAYSSYHIQLKKTWAVSYSGLHYNVIELASQYEENP